MSSPPTFTGSVVDTVSGAPILAFTADILSASRMRLLAAGYVTRDTSLNQRAVDLIPESGGFDLTVYRQLVRNAIVTPDALEPLRRWTVPPMIYLKTVDEANAPMPAAQLDSAEQALQEGAAAWGVMPLAGITRGTETREGQPGWITVKWAPDVGTGFCGQAQVARSGGWIMLMYNTGPGCGCGTLALRPRTVKHELGHALGFWHTDSTADLMSAQGVSGCDASPSARERYHAAIAYKRPVGSTDVDVDPVAGTLATHSRVVTITD